MKKAVSIFALLFLVLSLVFSQLDNKETINGKEFYKYEVKEGDNLYRISKSFAIPTEEIIQFNPPAQMGVSKGMKLMIPVESTWNTLNNTKKAASTETIAPAKVPTPAPAPIKAPVEAISPAKPIVETPAKQEKTTLVIPSRISSSDEEVFKVHIVEQGETMYKLIKLYNTDQQTLIKYNPNLANGVKIGERVRIPVSLPKPIKREPSKVINGDYIEHTVEAKENWYSISRLYSVSVDALNKANPNLAPALNIGQIVKVPRPGLIKAESQKISAAPKVSTIITTAPKAATLPKPADIKPAEASKPLIAPIVTPVAPVTPKPASTSKPTDMIVRVALLLPFMSNNQQKQDATIDKFVEFYEGALLGINKLKEDGVSVELNTFDIEKTEAKVREVLIKNPNLKKMDLIIGPAYSAQVNALTEFARANKIAVVVPFSSKIDSIANNPYIFQNNCTQTKQFNKAAQLFAQKFAEKNIIVLNFNNDTEDEGSEFVRVLKSQLKKQKVSFQDIQFTQESFNALQDKLTPGKETVIVMATDKSILVKDLLPKISAFNSTDKPVSIFGFSKWESTLKAYPSTYYYTSFFVARGNKDNAQYRNLFRQEFGFPSTSNPRFDLMGFDISTYFIKGISTYGKGFASKLGEYQQSYSLQSKFNFVRTGEGGYINEGIHIVLYDNEKGSKIVE